MCSLHEAMLSCAQRKQNVPSCIPHKCFAVQCAAFPHEQDLQESWSCSFHNTLCVILDTCILALSQSCHTSPIHTDCCQHCCAKHCVFFLQQRQLSDSCQFLLNQDSDQRQRVHCQLTSSQ